MKRWKVAVYDVGGNEHDPIATTFTRWGAHRAAMRYRRAGQRAHGRLAPTGVLELIPGRPLYTITIERI